MPNGIFWAAERNFHGCVSLHIFLAADERDEWAAKPIQQRTGRPCKRPSAFDVTRLALGEEEAIGLIQRAERTSPLARPVVHSHKPGFVPASA